MGKGRAERQVYLGTTTSRALWAYLQEHPRRETDALFISDLGPRAGRPLTRWGVFQLIQRLGQAAGLDHVRCFPHTFRHTFAIKCQMNGCQEVVLMRLLGHTRLDMTNKYVNFARANVEERYQQFSPVDRMGR